MNWIHGFQLFLFDFDGLLVDTERLHYEAYVHTMARRGYRLDWSFSRYSELAHLNASSIQGALCAQFPGLDLSWAQVYAEKKQIYWDLISTSHVQFMPGVERLLQALEQANIRRCVVTHSLGQEIQEIRAQLPLLNTIPHWVTRENYQKPKPDPECYLQAIQLFGQPGDRIIGFEDSVRGLQALQETSALPVLVCSSSHPLLSVALARGRMIHIESFASIPS